MEELAQEYSEYVTRNFGRNSIMVEISDEVKIVQRKLSKHSRNN
jgi:hypothetical protein